MRRHLLTIAILLFAAGAASAQWGDVVYPYGTGGLSWPGAYSYTQRYYWYGYNWPYPGYFAGKYHGVPLVPRDAAGPGKSSGSSERSSYYSYGANAESARVTIRVPAADAEVWVEGKATQKRGLQREFLSPRLDPNEKYVYKVRARWTENGRSVEQTRSVNVQANEDAVVEFTPTK